MKEKLEFFKQKFEEYLKLKEQISAELQLYVVDQSIPLDERWDVFCKSGLGNEESFYEDFKNFKVDDWCDNFDRHETIILTDIVKESWFYTFKSDEAYNEFREDVLKRFIRSFINDW